VSLVNIDLHSWLALAPTASYCENSFIYFFFFCTGNICAPDHLGECCFRKMLKKNRRFRILWLNRASVSRLKRNETARRVSVLGLGLLTKNFASITSEIPQICTCMQCVCVCVCACILCYITKMEVTFDSSPIPTLPKFKNSTKLNNFFGYVQQWQRRITMLIELYWHVIVINNAHEMAVFLNPHNSSAWDFHVIR